MFLTSPELNIYNVEKHIFKSEERVVIYILQLIIQSLFSLRLKMCNRVGNSGVFRTVPIYLMVTGSQNNMKANVQIIYTLIHFVCNINYTNKTIKLFGKLTICSTLKIPIRNPYKDLKKCNLLTKQHFLFVYKLWEWWNKAQLNGLLSNRNNLQNVFIRWKQIRMNYILIKNNNHILKWQITDMESKQFIYGTI